MDVSAFNVAEIERMISEVPDEAWYKQANKKTNLDGLFCWSMTSQQYQFWDVIDDHFTVNPTAETEIAELEATIEKAQTTIEKAQKRLAELTK